MTMDLLVIPCYNEAKRLVPESFISHLNTSQSRGFLFVDDGSSDGTGDILARIKREAPAGRVSVLSLPANVGKGESVRLGFLAALRSAPQFVGYCDADLSTPLESMDALFCVIERRPDIDYAFATRSRIPHLKRPWYRRILGKIFARLACRLFGFSLSDPQCGAKVFRIDPLVEEALRAPWQSRWIFDIEFLLRLRALRKRERRPSLTSCLHEEPLPAWKDIGPSRFRLKDGPRCLWELTQLAWTQSR